MVGVDVPNIKYRALNIWVPYAWDETSGTTAWDTYFDSAGDSCKEHYVMAHTYPYGIPVSSVAILCSLYQSGVGNGDGAVDAGLYLDNQWAGSSTKVKSHNYSMVAFSATTNTWNAPSSHIVSFRIRASGTTKGVTKLYDFYVKGR